jgi:methyl-CpG-binding domain protein 2
MNFRTVRSDASLVPPIRQTASIFKQPVTLIKNQEGKVKSDPKQGTQEKPKQLFWEKRLEVCYKKSLKKNLKFH